MFASFFYCYFYPIKLFIYILLFLIASFKSNGQSTTDSIIAANFGGETEVQINALLEVVGGIDSISKRLDLIDDISIKAEKIGYKQGVMEAEYLKAVAYNKIASTNNAITYFQNTIKLAQELKDSNYIAFCYKNIGGINMDLHKYDVAKKNLFTAVKYLTPNSKTITSVYNNLGTLYKGIGDYDSSLYFHNKTLLIREKNNDTIGLAYSYNNIGLTYKHSGDYQKALSYLKKSLVIKEKFNDTKGIGGSYINIGSVYFLQKKYKESYEYASKGLLLTQSVNAKYFTLSGSDVALRALLKLKSEKAFELYTLYDSLYTELRGEEILNNTEANQIKFDVANKEQQLALEKAKANELNKTLIAKEEKEKRLNFIIVFGIIGLIILIAFLVVVYKSFKNKKALSLSLEQQNLMINKKNKDITDSINYAKKIQNSIMPNTTDFGQLFSDSLIYYQPKDIVSGDFYWFQQIGNSVIFAAADCTGHGVPGAMMSVICVNSLNHFTQKKEIVTPEDALYFIDKEVYKSTNGGGSESRMADGMDIALCVFHKDSYTLQYSGANRPLLLIRNNEVVIYKANKFPIGQDVGVEKKFKGETIQLQKDDTVYIFTDGIVDQFGGEKGKKLLFRRLKEYLLSIQSLPFNEQKTQLDTFFNLWKGEEEQVDDVLLIGIKV